MADLPLATDEMRRQLALPADRQYGIDPGAGNDRGYAFNQWLPFSTNRVGSPSWVQQGTDPQWAVPEIAQGGLLGVAGMADAPRTGKLTPEALGSLLTGSGLAGGLLAPEGSLAAGGAIKAYHGSPHDFERFSFENIGTGEGAQAYGHGLYFAESPQTAEFYKQSLALKTKDEAERLAAVYVDTYGEHALDSIKRDAMSRHADPNTYAPSIKLLEAGWKPQPGKMYEVNINADPQKFLDWDKPLSGQSAEVDAALTSILRDRNRTPGEWIGSSPGAEARMQEVGIPGVRYLDQGSRDRGAGTSNYVVFPTQDEIIQILRKYGLAAPSPVVPTAQGAAPTTPGLLSDRQSEIPTKDRVY